MEAELEDDDEEEEDAFFAGAGPQVTVSEGAISSTFGIDGLSTIPSDNSSHKVSIAVSCRVFRVKAINP